MDHYWPILKNRNFILLWVSQVSSQLSIHTINFLLILKMFETTGSTVATSFLWLAYALPSLVVGPFASAFADIADRHKILVVSKSLQAAIVIASIFFIADNMSWAYAFVFLYSTINQFYVPSEFATLPTLVQTRQYAQANSLFLITQQVAVVIGFTISASLEGIAGFEVTLLICALFLLFAASSVAFLPKDRKLAVLPEKPRSYLRIYADMIWNGYRYILDTKYVFYPLLVLMLMSSVVAVVTVNMPIIALEIIKIPAESSGLIIALPVGLGALVGAFFSSKALGKGVRKYLLIKSALSSFIVGLLMMNFGPEVFRPLVGLYVSVFGILILGFSFVGMVIPVMTYLQEAILDEFRGRVFGSYWFVVTIVSIIPVISSGFLSEHFGPRVLFWFLIMGSLCSLVFVVRNGESFVRNTFRKS